MDEIKLTNIDKIKILINLFKSYFWDFITSFIEFFIEAKDQIMQVILMIIGWIICVVIYAQVKQEYNNLHCIDITPDVCYENFILLIAEVCANILIIIVGLFLLFCFSVLIYTDYKTNEREYIKKLKNKNGGFKDEKKERK